MAHITYMFTAQTACSCHNSADCSSRAAVNGMLRPVALLARAGAVVHPLASCALFPEAHPLANLTGLHAVDHLPAQQLGKPALILLNAHACLLQHAKHQCTCLGSFKLQRHRAAELSLMRVGYASLICRSRGHMHGSWRDWSMQRRSKDGCTFARFVLSCANSDVLIPLSLTMSLRTCCTHLRWSISICSTDNINFACAAGQVMLSVKHCRGYSCSQMTGQLQFSMADCAISICPG